MTSRFWYNWEVNYLYSLNLCYRTKRDYDVRVRVNSTKPKVTVHIGIVSKTVWYSFDAPTLFVFSKAIMFLRTFFRKLHALKYFRALYSAKLFLCFHTICLWSANIQTKIAILHVNVFNNFFILFSHPYTRDNIIFVDEVMKIFTGAECVK